MGGLVLRRRLNESIVIDGNITIKVIELESNAVRFRIDAPREISVHRLEIHQRIQSEQQAKDGV